MEWILIGQEETELEQTGSAPARTGMLAIQTFCSWKQNERPILVPLHKKGKEGEPQNSEFQVPVQLAM